MLALNESYLEAGQGEVTLRQGDELALIPPIREAKSNNHNLWKDMDPIFSTLFRKNGPSKNNFFINKILNSICHWVFDTRLLTGQKGYLYGFSTRNLVHFSFFIYFAKSPLCSDLVFWTCVVQMQASNCMNLQYIFFGFPLNI